MITLDKNKAAEFLNRNNVKIVREFVADRQTNIRLLMLHYTRTSGSVETKACLLYPDHSVRVMQLDLIRSVVANVEQWSDLERVNQMLRAEIAHYFFTKLARSSEDMALFRHDQQRLLQVKFLLRQLAELNRVVLAEIENPREPIGANERETGLPDRLFWTEENRGKLEENNYFIRRTIVHHNVPNLTIHDDDKVNRDCFVDIHIAGPRGRKLRIEKKYPLCAWPTSDQILEEYADKVKSMVNGV